MPQKRILLLINPNAGRGKGRETGQTAMQQLTEKDLFVETRESTHSGHMFELAEAAVTENWDGIVAVGGDGTLFEIINGMMRGNPDLPIPLGAIPVGTGNSFIRDVNIETIEDGIESIVRGVPRPVDLGQFICPEGTFYFVNLLGLGFVADVANRANLYKKWGALSYVIGVFQITRQLEFYNLKMQVDGELIERENCFVEVCNSTKTGGDMIMAPMAKIDDGELDIVIMNRIGKLRLLSVFPKIFKGTHVEIPEVEVFRGRKIHIETSAKKILTPDGEFLGKTPVDILVLPQKLQVFA
ncbi:diacylglycerol kinase family lipid kinase [bacterium]|nr:diacylglycerol kinase family lipid kinase [bacterium]